MRISLLLILVLIPFMQANAQQVMSPRNGYPTFVRQQVVSECLNQTPASDLKISPTQLNAYCLCYYNFMEQYLPYNDFVTLDNQLRSGQAQAVSPNTRALIEKGATTCFQYFVKRQQ